MDDIAVNVAIDRHATLDFANQDANDLAISSKFKKRFRQLKKEDQADSVLLPNLKRFFFFA